MLPFDYKKALYRKNNHGQPCVWYGCVINHSIEVWHGILGKTITHTVLDTSRLPADELISKIRDKRKSGYKLLSELKDDSNTYPVEGELINYLNTYLTDYRTTADGSLLPMLAKTYDNDNNKLFKKVNGYIGQYKINGLRCFISAEQGTGLFNSIALKFQSREGTYWNSLNDLEEYLLSVIPSNLLDKMLEEHYILDGELYLPGHSVNEINHFVKDPTCKENKLIQYWCYDLAIENVIQSERMFILDDYLKPSDIHSYDQHLNNNLRLVRLPSYSIINDEYAISIRNQFIKYGFEGLIMRNPNAEYQYGKRNSAMIKYKKSTDGKFLIIDIKPEGAKRPDIPLFVCKNDINDQLFECHVGGSLDYQRKCLIDKDKLIGKYMYVEFGERSGVGSLPFHVKTTYII